MECCGNACGPEFSKEALKQRLTAQQYQVTQEKETERLCCCYISFNDFLFSEIFKRDFSFQHFPILFLLFSYY